MDSTLAKSPAFAIVDNTCFRHTKPLHISRGFKVYLNELCFLDKANRVQVNEEHRIHNFN